MGYTCDKVSPDEILDVILADFCIGKWPKIYSLYFITGNATKFYIWMLTDIFDPSCSTPSKVRLNLIASCSLGSSTMAEYSDVLCATC